MFVCFTSSYFIWFIKWIIFSYPKKVLPIVLLFHNQLNGPSGFFVHPVEQSKQAKAARAKLKVRFHISLILRKNKPSESCTSYRPVTLTGVDCKILAKVLAARLERFLPNSISPIKRDLSSIDTCTQICNDY